MLLCTCCSSEAYATCKPVDLKPSFGVSFTGAFSDNCCVPGASAGFVKDHKVLVCDNRKFSAGKDISQMLILFVLPLCCMNVPTSCRSDTVQCHAGDQCVIGQDAEVPNRTISSCRN